jgi:hypothetical protein
VFINLETDPQILHSSPCCACVNLPPPIAFGLPLMSVLGCYSDSRSHLCSDTTRTLCSSSVIHLPLSASLQSCTHVYQPHSELCVYPRYKFLELHLDIRVSICLTSPSPHLRTLFRPLSLSTLRSEPLPSNSAQTSTWASARTSVSHSVLRVQACAFGACSDLCPCLRYECHADLNRS